MSVEGSRWHKKLLAAVKSFWLVLKWGNKAAVVFAVAQVKEVDERGNPIEMDLKLNISGNVMANLASAYACVFKTERQLLEIGRKVPDRDFFEKAQK